MGSKSVIVYSTLFILVVTMLYLVYKRTSIPSTSTTIAIDENPTKQPSIPKMGGTSSTEEIKFGLTANPDEKYKFHFQTTSPLAGYTGKEKPSLALSSSLVTPKYIDKELVALIHLLNKSVFPTNSVGTEAYKVLGLSQFPLLYRHSGKFSPCIGKTNTTWIVPLYKFDSDLQVYTPLPYPFIHFKLRSNNDFIDIKITNANDFHNAKVEVDSTSKGFTAEVKDIKPPRPQFSLALVFQDDGKVQFFLSGANIGTYERTAAMLELKQGAYDFLETSNTDRLYLEYYNLSKTFADII